MDKRESVIKWMKYCVHSVEDYMDCLECPYYGARCMTSLLEDAIEVLEKEAEEPKVLTWAELWEDGHPDSVWVEERTYSNHPFLCEYDSEEKEYKTSDYSYSFEKSEKNELDYDTEFTGFRAWSREPTERLRKAILWSK